jgi:hypothetical protein
MSQSELVNGFALGWEVFIILYMVIGMFSFSMILIMSFYHWLV